MKRKIFGYLYLYRTSFFVSSFRERIYSSSSHIPPLTETITTSALLSTDLHHHHPSSIDGHHLSLSLGQSHAPSLLGSILIGHRCIISMLKEAPHFCVKDSTEGWANPHHLHLLDQSSPPLPFSALFRLDIITNSGCPCIDRAGTALPFFLSSKWSALGWPSLLSVPVLICCSCQDQGTEGRGRTVAAVAELSFRWSLLQAPFLLSTCSAVEEVLCCCCCLKRPKTQPFSSPLRWVTNSPWIDDFRYC